MAKWQKRSDYNAMMYLRPQAHDNHGKNNNETGLDSQSDEEVDDNEANLAEIEKIDKEIEI